MSLSVAIYHKTEYVYDRKVFLSPHLFRLRPAAHAHAVINSYQLTILPPSHYIHWQQDLFGNFIARADFSEAINGMSLEVRLDATLNPYNPFDFLLDDFARFFPFYYPSRIQSDLASYTEILDWGPRITDLVQKARALTGDTIGFLVELNKLIYNHVGYIQRMQAGIQTCEQTLESGMGACRDSAWLLVQVMRHLGLASRFASGYLVQFIGDATIGSVDLHAWAEVFIPGAGWIGLDATSGLFTSEGHIPLACTPRPADAAVVTGTTDPCQSNIYYQSSVTKLPAGNNQALPLF
ncbi:transglutaminase family protein [Dyadobacter pollutisoli]|uniref:Transglutaminase family protein n=1 Tax=Dyadobacter pollutisoli TaxID=2910158 RepID=A0A9E8NBG0_9BACT|nr:transglutaminase family protein [Dyadobacter pollutisoli]WAC13564.1 transglutaminase family protein [Dyadobacter pollutisoli]